MSEVTFYRIVMVCLMLFSLFVAYTREPINWLSNNNIQNVTINNYVNVSNIEYNQNCTCECRSPNYGWFYNQNPNVYVSVNETR